jgi:hypothetical protein
LNLPPKADPLEYQFILMDGIEIKGIQETIKGQVCHKRVRHLVGASFGGKSRILGDWPYLDFPLLDGGSSGRCGALLFGSYRPV